MEASAGLVAGSHNRNELVVIHGHEEPKALKDLSGQNCEICGDEIGVTVDGDLFVACNECGFPMCRPCYEYDTREGTQLCPQCKTRYKRLKALVAQFERLNSGPNDIQFPDSQPLPDYPYAPPPPAPADEETMDADDE